MPLSRPSGRREIEIEDIGNLKAEEVNVRKKGKRVRNIWQMGYLTYKRTGCDNSPEHNYQFNVTAIQ